MAGPYDSAANETEPVTLLTRLRRTVRRVGEIKGGEAQPVGRLRCTCVLRSRTAGLQHRSAVMTDSYSDSNKSWLCFDEQESPT